MENNELSELGQRKVALKKELDEVSAQYEVLYEEHLNRSALESIAHDLEDMGLAHMLSRFSARNGYMFDYTDGCFNFDVWADLGKNKSFNLSAWINIQDSSHSSGQAYGEGSSFREAFLALYNDLSRLKSNTQEVLSHLESISESIKPKA